MPLADALAALPDAALLVDAGGTVRAANDAAAVVFARPAGVLGGDAAGLLGAPLRAFGSGAPVRTAFVRADGVPVSADVSLGPATPAGRVLVVREVAGAQLLREARSVIDLAFDHTPIAAALFNTDGEYIRVNENLCRLLDRTPEDLLGRRDQELTHPDDRAADVEAAWRILRGELDTHQTEKRFVRPDGSVVWAIANMTFLRDDAGRPVCWVGQFQDITERHSLEQRLRRLADDDPLTGLPNRRHFDRELALAVARGSGALLVIDLDGFKEVNDSLGHTAGDGVLVRVAAALRARLRRSDVLARTGGDEFAVILPEAGPEHDEAVAAQIAAAVAAVEVAPGLGLTASIGRAAIDGTDGPAEVYALADIAMYAAKRRAALGVA